MDDNQVWARRRGERSIRNRLGGITGAPDKAQKGNAILFPVLGVGGVELRSGRADGSDRENIASNALEREFYKVPCFAYLKSKWML